MSRVGTGCPPRTGTRGPTLPQEATGEASPSRTWGLLRPPNTAAGGHTELSGVTGRALGWPCAATPRAGPRRVHGDHVTTTVAVCLCP